MWRALGLLLLLAPPVLAQGEASLDSAGTVHLRGQVSALLDEVSWWAGPGDTLTVEAESVRGFVFGSHALSDGRAARVVLHQWEVPLAAQETRLRLLPEGLLVVQAEQAGRSGVSLTADVVPTARKASLQDSRHGYPLDFAVPAGRFGLDPAPLNTRSALIVMAAGSYEGTFSGWVGRVGEGAMLNITYLVLEVTGARFRPEGGALHAAAFASTVSGTAAFPAATGFLHHGETWTLHQAPVAIEGEFTVDGFPRESPPSAVRLLATSGGQPRYVVEGNFRAVAIHGWEVHRAATAQAAASLAVGAVVLWLFSRLAGSEVTLHPARAALIELVRTAPGIQQGRAGGQVGIFGGALQHHIRVLERARLIRVERVGRFRLLYPRGHASTPRADLQARGRALAVYDSLVARPGATARELAEIVGITRQLATHHLAALHRAGLARREGDAPSRWYA